MNKKGFTPVLHQRELGFLNERTTRDTIIGKLTSFFHVDCSSPSQTKVQLVYVASFRLAFPPHSATYRVLC